MVALGVVGCFVDAHRSEIDISLGRVSVSAVFVDGLMSR